ncbi:glutamine amidotransferase [Halomonas salipaludis]|uniref:Glutamine amidotransferase n=1 Tax=Halomonas salipaludis TaxID=2032625 RepID=A0A2A2EUT4_9GAMM|nr:glutamine amidotransferase [Halomonas salipaludis]PAU76107.1 glutamine amidotransferase [Halomonas salipaludis]
MKVAHVIRHIHFEDLGLLTPVLADHGYHHYYWDVGVDDLNELERMTPDLLVILGGPLSANDVDAYPFLAIEQRLAKRQIASGRPLLGICLGAQIIARVMGGRVEPMDCKEIDFAPLTMTEAGHQSVLAPLADAEAVLHWHGEACQIDGRLPTLAQTPVCTNQGFLYGSQVLGLQFHLEVPLQGFERWLVGHCHELASAGTDVAAMRTAAQRFLPRLEPVAREVFHRWLTQCA